MASKLGLVRLDGSFVAPQLQPGKALQVHFVDPECRVDLLRECATGGEGFDLEKSFRNALQDLKPAKAFIVYSGVDRYPKSENVEVISVRDMAQEIAALSRV